LVRRIVFPGALRQVAGVVCAALCVAALSACSGGPDEVVCAREPTEMEEGLVVEDTTCGRGDPAGRGDLLAVSYTASVQGEDRFEQSDEPYRFRLGVGEVIEGWDIGILGMQEGGVRKLTISPDLGYGSTGLEPHIPPGATLVYEIELVSQRVPKS
jgi:FKBP-type peptidyl-prolyl cis-trans isomerase